MEKTRTIETSGRKTFRLCKTFAKVLGLEIRDKAADGLYTVAEKIDITTAQETECSNFHLEMDELAKEKELNKSRKTLKVATA